MKSLLGDVRLVVFVGLVILGYGEVCRAKWTFITEDPMESRWYVDLSTVQMEKREGQRFITYLSD